MAIRFPTQHNTADWNQVAQASLESGWRMVMASGLAPAAPRAAMQAFQPSALSRPGNLGTAYDGVWTEDISSPNDNHIPIPFKVLTIITKIEPRRLIRRLTRQSSRSPS